MIAALVTGFLYCVGRVFLDRQYRTVGVTSEEVGLDELGILSRLIVPIIGVLVLLILLGLGVSGGSMLSGWFRALAIGVAVVAGLSIVGWAVMLGDLDPRTALPNGEDALLVDADCVELDWLIAAPESDPLEGGSVMWFLGARDGTGVFYRTTGTDPVTLRLPLGDLVSVSRDSSACKMRK